MTIDDLRTLSTNIESIPGIYGIISKSFPKIYIGSSNNIAARIKKHKSQLIKNNHHCKYLQNAWNKYGEADFIFIIIEKVDLTLEEKRLNELRLFRFEQKYIDKYSDYLYNSMRVAGQYKNYKLNFEEQKREIIASYIEDNTNLWFQRMVKEITVGSFEVYRREKHQEMVTNLKLILSKNISIEAENKIETPLKPSFNKNEIRLIYFMVLSLYLSVFSLGFSEIVATVFAVLGIILSILSLVNLHRHAR